MRILIQVRQGKWNSGNFQGKMSKAAVELKKVSWILLFNDVPPLYCHLKMNGSRDLFVGRSTKVHPKRSQSRRTLVNGGARSSRQAGVNRSTGIPEYLGYLEGVGLIWFDGASLASQIATGSFRQPRDRLGKQDVLYWKLPSPNSLGAQLVFGGHHVHGRGKKLLYMYIIYIYIYVYMRNSTQSYVNFCFSGDFREMSHVML